MSYNPYSLVGKRILITGASSGIGRASAIECSKLGAHLIILGRDELRLNETLELMSGDAHQMFAFDINDDAGVDQFISMIPALDGIVYSAGTLITSPAKFITKTQLTSVFDTNFNSVVHLTSLLLQSKKINKEASLVFISSVAGGLVAEHGNAIYSASKAAMIAYSKVLALELSSRKVRVNSILPAMLNTSFLKNCTIDESEFDEDQKRYPLGYGTAEDVALAVVYFLSPASKWLTGSQFVMDGGLTLR